jgi:hypothetical protein
MTGVKTSATTIVCRLAGSDLAMKSLASNILEMTEDVQAHGVQEVAVVQEGKAVMDSLENRQTEPITLVSM